MMKYLDKEQQMIIKILIVIVSIICISFIIILFNKDKFVKKSQFVIPELEQNSITGKPSSASKKCMYKEAKVNDEYIVYLCAIPTFKDNILTIYFTSDEVNKGLIKIKVLDSDNNVIGESGLINPNSYIKNIKLNKELKNKERITIKVMHYEKETYYSLGGIKLDLFVRKIDD